MFFDSIKVEANDCFAIEENPILQSNSSAWLDLQINRLTSSNADKILTCKKSFETLADEFLEPEAKKKLPKVVKDTLKNDKLHEPTARQN